MRFYHFVAHSDYIVYGKLCGGVGVHHCGVIYVISAFGNCSLNSKELRHNI